jgi:hypothetical protein
MSGLLGPMCLLGKSTSLGKMSSKLLRSGSEFIKAKPVLAKRREL